MAPFERINSFNNSIFDTAIRHEQQEFSHNKGRANVSPQIERLFHANDQYRHLPLDSDFSHQYGSRAQFNQGNWPSVHSGHQDAAHHHDGLLQNMQNLLLNSQKDINTEHGRFQGQRGVSDESKLSDTMFLPTALNRREPHQEIAANRVDKQWFDQLQHQQQQQSQMPVQQNAEIQQRQERWQTQQMDQQQRLLDQQQKHLEQQQRLIDQQQKHLEQTRQQSDLVRRQRELEEQQRALKQQQQQQQQQMQQQQQKQEELIRQDNLQTKYVVKQNDTLESIATKQLGARDLWELIYELNKSLITVKMILGKQLYVLPPGSVLWLPSKKQIREWRRRRLSQQANTRQDTAVPRGFASDVEGTGQGDSRRSNVENLLGPIRKTNVPTYTVRLGDTLRSIAMKHPALNDVKLWKLLAEKNGLSVAADGKGNPTANLQRGTSLVLPTTMEILEFRSRGIKGLQSVKTSVDLSSVKTVVELVSQECPNCHRLITQSCEMCPACFFTIATQESDEPITERCDSMFISETPSTPLEYNGATARLDAQSEKTAFAFDSRRSKCNSAFAEIQSI